MSIALSTPQRLAKAASLLLLALTAACSGERPPRPQSDLAQTDMIVMPSPSGSPQTTAAIREYGSDNRIISLAEEEESHAITPSEHTKPQYAGNYGFTAPVENPVSTAENLYAMSNSEASCRRRLKQLGVVFTEKPAIYRNDSCRIDNPIEVTGFASGSIAFKPAAMLNCQVTEAFARWIKGDLQPSARLRYLSGVKTIFNAGGYSCRTMNNRRGANMSEHSRGNAIDVTKIALNNGKDIKVRKPGFFAFREKGLLNSVRSDACGYFSTVLGPGYNPEHADHFHFDLMSRRNGNKTCK